MGVYVYKITEIIQISVFILMMYYLIISLFGLYKKNENTQNTSPKNTFALIVAAHNEEMVIGNIIESLNSLDYPKKMYDVFVIADNCTDRTAAIARQAGSIVFERNNKSQKGKGYALEWMFNKIFKMEKHYDAIAVFDADNIVSTGFLREMDKSLKKGYKVVQGYLDSKNPHDTWITECYSIAFWTANRLFQLSRYNLGISSQIGGTGFCVCTDVLKEIGWGATCLTEDLEFTCKLVLNNYKVGWAQNAVVYDEKPLTLKQSWNQRKRWMQGFADVSSRFFFKLMLKAIKDKDFTAFDTALYTIQPFIIVAFGLSSILTFIQNNSEGHYIFVINYIFSPLMWKLFSIFQFLFTPFITYIEKKISKGLLFIFALYSTNVFIFSYLFKEGTSIIVISLGHMIYLMIFMMIMSLSHKKQNLKIFIWYLLYGIYTLTWIPITIQGILHKNDKEWHHTNHTRQISLYEIKSA